MFKSTTGFGRGVRRSLVPPRRSLLFLRGIKLLYFPMQGVAPKMGVVFLFLHAPGLEFLIARAHIARGRFALFSCLGAFECDDFAWHRLSFPLLFFGFGY